MITAQQIIIRTHAAAAVIVACVTAPTHGRRLWNETPEKVFRASLDPALPPYRPSGPLTGWIRTVGESTGMFTCSYGSRPSRSSTVTCSSTWNSRDQLTRRRRSSRGRRT